MNPDATPSFCESCRGARTFQPSHLLPNPVQLTQIRAILRSNAPISDPAYIQRLISEAPPELVRYDNEISRVTAVLDGLVSDRSILATHLDECKSVSSPVRRLPSELLVEIFDMCAPPNASKTLASDTVADEEDRLNARYLLRLSQVCAFWRGLAMETPRLWSEVVIDMTLWCDAKTPARFTSSLRSHLSRGGNSPLRLFADLSTPQQAVVDLLVEHSRRWRNVSLWFDFQFRNLAGAKGNLPSLKALHIENTGDQSDLGEVIDIFEVAPRLTRVTLCGPLPSLPIIPWQQLRFFEYITPPPRAGQEHTDLFGALSLMSRLSLDTDFSLDFEISGDSPVDLHPIVSNVSSLSLTFFSVTSQSHVLGEVFKALTLPRLKRLEIPRRWSDPPPLWGQTHFLMFASRSSLQMNLTELEVHIVITDEELLKCLSVLPNLTRLGISDCGGPHQHILITDNLLRHLTWKPDSNCLIPHLHIVFFTSLFHFADDVFWDFLASRLVPGRKLAQRSEAFQVTVWWLAGRVREFSSDVLTRITGFMERGELGFKTNKDPDEPAEY
ncbi:hypothetical protein C8F04DRAFT_1123940 [Mycena alexandri]|uniref:F-box domain-containing protein n=1 Tax=Mycena alexandri TaxID=1745969 RepID=A0AAD6WTS7_9AGAR|nr:hypothetical protein C8F04DRAFT_1123940 [Mycena alexandri]